MAWTPFQLTLAVGMVITGSINTLATKWADRQSAAGCANGNNPSVHPFDHPFLQAVGMFIGEFSCIVVFKVLFYWKSCHGRDTSEMGNQNFNPLIFFIPAMCDMAGTSLMYIGLNLTYASSFQMLRGAIIVFTALLSVAFLRRVIDNRMWSGIACVIIGLVLVGLSDILFIGSDKGNHGKNQIITGDLIIIIAQIVGAVQMVVEEKFVSGKNINSLQAVGWEGTFGMTVLGILLIPMYFITTGTSSDGSVHRIEDALDGLCQLGNNWKIALGTFGSVTSIAFFNFFGISVTKELSATTRMVLDSIRTVVIWVVSLSVNWESFHWLQILGFTILITGTAIYNNILNLKLVDRVKVYLINDPSYDEESSDTTPILASQEGNSSEA